MKTPILDFVRHYGKSRPIRFHMPGHKGKAHLGFEDRDITEIAGADVLYFGDGIIQESQKNAATLFGTGKTLYSTEGSTLAIRAMLSLAINHAKERGRDPLIVASRDAHKAFLTTCALLDFKVLWMKGAESSFLFSGAPSGEKLAATLSALPSPPAAVYITSPDYLGNLADIATLSRICHQYDTLLLVDNAHGAYLHFLPESHHPISLGADLACDSAHKTLPALTGGAYLHISKNAPERILSQAESAMALFASSSPSYLILQSLDGVNAYLSQNYKNKLVGCTERIEFVKKSLKKMGFSLIGNEPLKITVQTKAYGYTGEEMALFLQSKNIICEFYDPDHLVLMITPENDPGDLESLLSAMSLLPRRSPILSFPPKIPCAKAVMTPREAMLSPSVELEVSRSLGRILSQAGVTCPPAIPIAICGERIDAAALECFKYYSIKTIRVVDL